MSKISITALKELCGRIGDGLHGTPKYKDNTGLYFINGNNLKHGNISLGTAKTVSLKEFEKHHIKLNENCLLMSINGTLGELAFYKDEPIILGKSTAYIECISIDKYYLYYHFQLKSVQKHLWDIATGSTIKNLSLASIRGYSNTFPIIQKQKKIASVLTALDDKIALNNKINAELESMAKLIYDYWFVQFDFPISAEQAATMGDPTLSGKPYKSNGGPMTHNPTLKREIPVGWLDKTLIEIANITMGQSPNGSSYNDKQEGHIFYQGCTDFGRRFPTPRKYTTAPTRFAKKGDILLSVRAPVGSLNTANQDCCIGRGLAALNSKEQHDSYLINLMFYFKQIFDRRNTAGTTFGSITKNDLHSLKFAYPLNENILDEFESKIASAYQQIHVNHQQNQHLTTLRDWLLPMLMNGQVTVK